jgi:butyryl-CoA dehydrogenase
LWATGDATTALANSSVYLEAFGHTVIAWMWLEQLIATNGKSGDFYAGKRMAARYFFVHELPRTGPQLDLLDNGDRTTSEMNPQWF